MIQFNPELLQAGGGSGLGLFITKNIVSLHGGVISVYSQGEGHGTSFKFEIPMKVVDVGSSIQQEQTQGQAQAQGQEQGHREGQGGSVVNEDKKSFATPGASSEPTGAQEGPTIPLLCPSSLPSSSSTLMSPPPSRNGRPCRLLVVDDSQLNRKMLVRVMKAEGHECEEAVDGTFAVAKIEDVIAGRTLPFDAVLMDFVMPLMDGPTATQRIRALGYQGKVLGVTGNALQSDIDVFVRAGANAVLPKPLDMDRFRSLLLG